MAETVTLLLYVLAILVLVPLVIAAAVVCGAVLKGAWLYAFGRRTPKPTPARAPASTSASWGKGH